MRTILTVVCLIALACAGAFAQTNASSKATAAINTVTVCANNGAPTTCVDKTIGTGLWQDVMATSIKTSNVADLMIGVSMVTGLYTSTQVKGNGTGATSQAVASGSVEVRVVIDDNATLAYPDTSGGGIVFDQRIQTLNANLGYIFTDCFAAGGNTGTGCVLTQEQITLVLDTTAAHSFNFIALNVGTGMHNLKVQARVKASNGGADTYGGGVAVSNALYGLGSLTVESVRLVNSFSF